LKKIDAEAARKILSGGFVSAIGHEATAQLLSKLLGIQVPENRVSVFMEKGDKAVHFFLRQRLSEGAVLGEAELSKLDYWIILSEVEEAE
jgi:5-bromo-4-chloroindolyl phosphate hydrolysis protein